MLLDKADGTVARLLKASSRFGMELDSLADLICFCVAPAVLVLCVLAGPGRNPGLEQTALYRTGVYAGCFLFVIMGALRLAKFNVVSESYGRRFFFGIPTTSTGSIIAAYYLTVIKYQLPQEFVLVIPAIMVVLALLMVSRVPLPKLGIRKINLVNILVLVNIPCFYIFGLLRIFPEWLLVNGLLYLVGGSLWAMAKGIRPPGPGEEDEDAEEEEVEEVEQSSVV